MNIMRMAREADCIDFRDDPHDPHVKQMVEFLERFAALVMEEAANGADALAKKWWARHCETNKHMETTREAHEDFCQLGRAIRALKGAKE